MAVLLSSDARRAAAGGDAGGTVDGGSFMSATRLARAYKCIVLSAFTGGVSRDLVPDGRQRSANSTQPTHRYTSALISTTTLLAIGHVNTQVPDSLLFVKTAQDAISETTSTSCRTKILSLKILRTLQKLRE